MGPSAGERLALFQAMANDLKAAVILVRDRAELALSLQRLRDAGQWKKIGIHSGLLTDFAGDALGLSQCHTDRPYDVHELESCDAGITECDKIQE